MIGPLLSTYLCWQGRATWLDEVVCRGCLTAAKHGMAFSLMLIKACPPAPFSQDMSILPDGAMLCTL